MPRGKKNKGNSGSAHVPNNNKAKSPAETKVVEIAATTAAIPTVAPVPPLSETSNEDLKVRLANAKERLHLLQEVIGGIGDPADVENFKSSGIDAAKEKLNIIQDSVNAVKTTLLEVRQETARSVTPEGSTSGTNKKKKNKKHQNQNPPQGFVVVEQPAKLVEAVETKLKPDASENEGSAQEDGCSTISKKKRNRNKKKKGQQEQSSATELLQQGSNVVADAVKIDVPQPESKENSPEANKSKNNKKNNKKGQQKPASDVQSKNITVAEVKAADLNKAQSAEGKIDPSNDKNKNKNKKDESSDKEKGAEAAKDQNTIPKIQGDTNIKESKPDNKATDIPADKSIPIKTKGEQPSQKGNKKKLENLNVNPEDPKVKNDQKEKQEAEEKPAAKNENVLPTQISKTPEKEENIKTKSDPQKMDAPKNKKDKKKGQIADTELPSSKVEVKQPEGKVNLTCEKKLESVVEAISSKVANIVPLPKNESKEIDTKSSKTELQKNEKDKNDSQTAKSEEKTEKTVAVSIPPVEEKSVSTPPHQQSQKNKKNKQQVPAKTAGKKDESLIVEQTSSLVTDKISGEQIVTDLVKPKNQVQSPTTVRKEECNKNEASTSTPAVIPKSLENEERRDAVIPAENQTECKTSLEKTTEIIKAESKIIEDPIGKNQNENSFVAVVTPSLPKLDFSQVVKENKDKIPLMEIKAVPVLAAEVSVENKATDSVSEPAVVSIKSTDSAVKSETAIIDKPKTDAVVVLESTKGKPTPDATPVPTAVASSKSTLDSSVKSPQNIIEPKVNAPAPIEVEAATVANRNKAKTPERKETMQKNEQKKPQQGKGQSAKQKSNDQKPQDTKKEVLKHSEVTKVDTETKIATEIKIVAETKIDSKTKAVSEKEETKLDSPVTPVTPFPSTEVKVKEQITKKNENVKKEQAKQSSGEKKPEIETSPIEEIEEKQAPPTTEKNKQIIQDKTDKDFNKKSDTATVDATSTTSEETQIKDNKSVSSTPQNTATNRKPEPQKQEHKTEISKKDQKKQNKMKGKAPQPPDIPMDMSLLSASMIDPLTTVSADEVISHEESEDQSSLITSDSKNVAGSGFVQSVKSNATTDETKSLEKIPIEPKNENEVSEIDREAKNSSPTSSKKNKDMANLKESVVQFPAVKLLDILEAKMTSPAVKPGNIAGNVRKLPKEAKKTDQLNVQQQKSRSKSPKENIAEKYVKNQKMTSVDNKKQAAQNLKNEILKTEVGTLVTPSSKGKEVKEPTKVDANLELKSTTESDTKSSSTTTAVTESEHVGNLKESDAISKQKAEPLPKNSTISDTNIKQSDDSKTAGAVGCKKETKPKIAPKPNVPPKSSPKVVDRSKNSPAKTPENKNPKKESPGKETVTPSKTPVQAKPVPESKSPAKQPTQAKSTSPPKPPSQTPATATDTKTCTPQTKEAKCANPKKPEVPPKPTLPKATTNKMPPIAIQDEDEEFVEYKFTPRPVFISTACQICKVPLDMPNPCKQCQMVSYCSEEHEKEDQTSHGPLCVAIQEIAKKRGGHIYNNARILNDDDYRSLRVHTLNLCENFLKRHLLPFEREMLLFPRLCCTTTCREWRQQSLIECKQCGQVSYCAAHPEHLPQLHEKWCNSFNLYQKIVLRQKNFGRIEPSLPSKIMLKPFDLSDNMDNVFKILYKNYGAIKDDCIYATLTQLATAPLTALYGAQMNHQEIGEVYTIHLVGAELQFEADTLDKWETFFLHLVPTLVECRVVFVGPELNAENLPLEILSRIRMCRTCRQNCRIVKFDFQCGILYHDYANSSAFTKPDLICFFNPGLYRSTAFNGLDTWPNTIKSATSMNCPIVVTSYTEIESPRDMERIQKESDRPLSVVQSPQINPFASQRPERNFISDEVAPMIFKNFFCFCVK